MIDLIRKYSFGIIIFFTALSCCAFFFVRGLNLQLNPRVSPKKIYVTAVYPNALPDIVELNCTTPLESGLATIQGIERISSRSRIGGLEIELDIDKNKDADLLRFEVANKIKELFPSLPQELSYPQVRMVGRDDDRNNEALLTYSLYSTDAEEKITRYAQDQLIPTLSTISGVNYIELSGNREPEWVIHFDENKMKALNISVGDIASAVRAYLVSTSLGYARINGENLSILLENNEVAGLQNLLVMSDANINIYLKDVAEIKLQEKELLSIYRINGQTNVRLKVVPTKEANHLVSAGLVKDKIGALTKALPTGYQLLLEYDGTEFLKVELDKIKIRSLVSLLLLLIFVILIYRSLYSTIIILFSLVINLSLAIIAYNLLDININLYALAAITISFGIIIDNTLVIIHHLKRHRDLKVYPSLVSATLTTIASLIVIFFLPEIWKQNLSEFARVIVINLFISLIVSLLLVPSLYHRLTNKSSVNAVRSGVSSSISKLWLGIFGLLSSHRKKVMIAAIWVFGLPVFLLPAKIEDQQWYNLTLGSDTYREEIKPYVDRIFGGTFRLFYRYVYEAGQFRVNDETILYANVSLPDGSTIQQTDELCRTVEQYLGQFTPHQVKNYILNITNGERASLKITFADQNDYIFPYVLKNRLTSLASNLGGASWSIYGVGRGFSNASGSRPPRFTVIAKGYNLDQLEKWTALFAARLMEHPRIQEVDTDANINWREKEKYQYTLLTDKRVIAENVMTLRDVYEGIQALSPLRQFIGYTKNNVPIRIINGDVERKSIWNMENEIISRDSVQLNLTGLTSITKSQAPNTLHKQDQQYIKQIEWEYTGSARFGSQYLDKTMEEFIPALPLGYTFERKDRSFFNNAAKKQYGLLFLVAALIFMISCIHFESLKTAWSIILMIPISFIGIFLTFYLFDFPFDQGGYTSFILLSGITVNSIILILSDYKRNLHAENESDVAAYTTAFLDKITPILLTIISTVIGLVPFLMHGRDEPFWYSLAIGTIGGLLFSLFSLCFIMPAFVLTGSKKY